MIHDNYFNFQVAYIYTTLVQGSLYFTDHHFHLCYEYHLYCSYTFTCNRWLSSDFDDGKVDRILPASGNGSGPSFPTKFSEHAQYNISEDHIWLSLLMRPQRSNFTRVQRATCALCLLLLTMVSNAMYYKANSPVNPSQVYVGSIRFSLSDISISIISILITTPIILIISLLFRKSKSSRQGSTSASNEIKTRFTKILRKGNVQRPQSIACDEFYRTESAPLPSATRYFAWILLFLVMAGCVFIMLGYSMTWGRQKSKQWLLAFVLSFVESFLLIDPAKVRFLSVTAIINDLNFQKCVSFNKYSNKTAKSLQVMHTMKTFSFMKILAFSYKKLGIY